MSGIDMEEAEVRENTKFISKEGKTILVLRLHIYDEDFQTCSVEIIEENNKIKLKGDKIILHRIKNLLIKRENLIDVAWCLLQNEYRTLDKIEEKVEKLQNASIQSYSKSILENIVKIKKNLFYMHRDYIRLRNIIETAVDSNLEKRKIDSILRDINEIIEVNEYLVEATTTAIQLTQNTLSAKMNEVIKILTVIATIMMPLTLITGIYGMNFRYMPELYWKYGYYYSLILMLIVAVVMLLYFKKKKMM